MTWSIVAKEESTGRFGVAVFTCFFGVGMMVPFGRSNIGAIATQAYVNRFYGTEGLRLLEAGHVPEDIVLQLTDADAGRDQRQLHLIDRSGAVAAYTGAGCIPWCGQKAGPGFSVAGNTLFGAAVVDDTADAFAKHPHLPFAERLILAMKAGEAAGGDLRGKQSAALVIWGGEDWPDLELRVDDHPDPLTELERLERKSREIFVPMMGLLPNKTNPSGLLPG
jgi:uncharacterized Ntn-hydrolase superfamily protein